jgi:hypothetical protein
MSDARSYRSQPKSSIATPSSSVDASFVDPQNYDDYVAAARANALPPDSPLHPDALGRLSNLASSNPGISPDVAVAALTAGLDPNSDTVQYLQNMATQAKYEATMKQQADQRAQADQLSNQGAEGFLKGTSRTIFNVMDAPFQVIANAVNDTIAEAVHPDGPTATFGDVLFNTDAAHQIKSFFSNDKTVDAQGDFGTGWLPDPNSTGAQYKYNEDVRLSNGMAPSLGGKFADALELQHGTHPYSIVSGLVDLGSRVLDPTMYVGGAEVQGLLRGGKAGADAAALLRGAGNVANEAAKAIPEGERLLGEAFDSAKQGSDLGARASLLEQERKLAMDQMAQMHPEAPVLREQAAAAGQEADTRVFANIDAESRQSAEEWQQSKLDIEAMKKQAEHDAVTDVTNSINEAEYMGAQKAEMLANGHDIPRAPDAPVEPTTEEVMQHAQEMYDTDREQYKFRYEHPEQVIIGYLSVAQRGMFEKSGVIPSSVVRRMYKDLGTERASGTIGVGYNERLEPELGPGHDRLQARLDEMGGSKELGDILRNEFRYGKSNLKVVRVPWMVTRDQAAEKLADMRASAASEIQTAYQEQHAAEVAATPRIDIAAATDSSRESIDAVRKGVLSSAEKLGEEFNLPEDTVASLMGVNGKTTGEVVDNVKNVLTESGLPQTEVEKFMYTLNDELMQHGTVVDGHPDLAPAGRGRDIAATHQAEQDSLQRISDLSNAHAEHMNDLNGLSEEIKQRLVDLQEGPIQKLNKEEATKNAKADRLDASKVRADAKRLASLNYRLNEVNRLADLALQQRDDNLAAMKTLTDQVAKLAGKETPEGEAAQMQLLRDLAGLRTTANGVDSLVVDKGIKFLLGTKAEPLYKAVAAIDDPVAIRDLTRGKLPVAMCKDLAAAKTTDEVRSVLVRNIGSGMVDDTTGRLMSLRIAGRAAMGGKDPEVMLSPYQRAFGSAAKAVRYGTQIGKRNVPWSHARDVSDHEGMTDLVSDTINYMDRLWRHPSEQAGAFHDEWVGKMMDATTPEARRTVWYQMLDKIVERSGNAQGLSDEMIGDLQESLKASRARQQQLTSYLAEARAANLSDEELVFQGQKLPKDIAMLESEMSNRVMSPDWRNMRRALKSADSLKRAAEGNPENRAALLAAVDNVFDNFWRTSVLAFRGGYVIRNTADIAARQFLAGQPGLFTSPWGIAAMVFGHKVTPNSALGKLLNAAERADVDVTGAKYVKVQDEDALMTQAMDGYNRVAARNVSLLDPGAPSRANRLGIQSVTADSPHFHKGWANEIGMLHASPIANEVFKVMIGKPSTPVKQWSKQTGILSQRDALVDYFWNGPGRTSLDRLFDSSSHMKDLIKSPEDLQAYMFGEDLVSLSSRWNRLTLDLNPTIVDHVSSGGFRDAIPEGNAVREGADFTARRKASENLLKQVAPSKATQAADFPVKSVRAPIWVNKGEQNYWTVKMQQYTDAFFHGASQIEKHAGYLPEFKYAKWENAADLASALHPEDAAKLVATAKEALGGGFYFSWASKTLRRLEANAARAKGDGSFDLDTLSRITDQHGVNVVKNMFYDAQKRNAFGHATRLISPFAQAWANSLKTWGLLAAKNPQQVYKVASLYEAGMGKNTSPLDNPSNPDNALFYQDPKTGQAMVGIPLAGDLMALAGSITSMAHGGQPIDPSTVGVNSPVSSFNLLFQNGLLPSVGPALSVPASSLDSTQQYNAMIPDWLKKTLVPYVNVNPDTQPGVLEAALPGWLGNFLGGVGVAGFQDRITKYVKPAMGTLFSQNPSRYLNSDGLMDQDGQSRLLQDSQALAYGLTFSKGILQNMSAGSVMPDLYAKDKNGNNLSQLVLGKEYSDLEYSLGSRKQALAALADKYGMDVLMTMLPNREFGYLPTDAAYQFVTSHPDIADKNGAVLSLFLPGGGYSALLDRMNRERMQNPSLSANQMVEHSNELLHQAALGQLERKLTAGQINTDEFNAQTKVLNDQYKSVPQPSSNLNNTDLAIKQLRIGLQSKELANTEAGRAIDVYMQVRDAVLARASGGSLSGQGDAELRSWLRMQGEGLVVKYPEFAVAWAKVFRKEVEN